MVITAVVVVLILTGWGWSLTHPNLIDGSGSGVYGTAEVGESILFGIAPGPKREVVLRHAAGHVTVNTASADVRVVLCNQMRDRSVLGSKLGTAAAQCTSLTPLAGAHLRRITSDRSAQLLVQVTPRRVGEVVIDGVDLAYRAGIRWGWQRTGPTIRLRVSPAAPG
jgi:hypothetical protein